MITTLSKRYLYLMLMILVSSYCVGQTVPFGIHYQAVARDNYGKEYTDKEIDVKFSILAGNPLGDIVYQELHSKTRTSKYGVFSLVIGSGTPTGGTNGELSQITWGDANHYLNVEVRFDKDFIDMGTMQFLAVPYALYAQRSLEPGPQGPQGPKGEQGDPATDDQQISFDGNNLSIERGNLVSLDGLLQNLTVTNGPDGSYLGITKGNSVKIATIEADGDPANEIQDLIYDNAKRELRLLKSSAPVIDLNELKNDADADPLNEIQEITYNPSTYSLSISGGSAPVSLGNIIAFRSRKLLSVTASSMSDLTFLPSVVEYNEGNAFNAATGEFVAPVRGIYTFSLSYFADGTGSSRRLSIYHNSVLYEVMADEILSQSTVFPRSVTMKLDAGDVVKLVINTGTSTQSGTGSFSGFRIY
jgi:hypothetical protein